MEGIELETGGQSKHGHLHHEARAPVPHNQTVLQRLRPEPFLNDTLAQELKRRHITGIAFSAAVGVGLFQTSGEVIAMGGPLGAFLAFVFAGLVIFSVMRCLAEMVSVRPVPGALMDFPSVFVDEALGFTVGITYW